MLSARHLHRECRRTVGQGHAEQGLGHLVAAQGLGPLVPMEVAAFRSRESRGNPAVDALHDLLVRTLPLAGGPDAGRRTAAPDALSNP